MRPQVKFDDPADHAGESYVYSNRHGFYVFFNEQKINFTFPTFASADNYLTVLRNLEYLLLWLELGYHKRKAS
jgi:hypothetical protein